jgi:hypothetical protein
MKATVENCMAEFEMRLKAPKFKQDILNHGYTIKEAREGVRRSLNRQRWAGLNVTTPLAKSYGLDKEPDGYELHFLAEAGIQVANPAACGIVNFPLTTVRPSIRLDLSELEEEPEPEVEVDVNKYIKSVSFSLTEEEHEHLTIYMEVWAM